MHQGRKNSFDEACVNPHCLIAEYGVLVDMLIDQRIRALPALQAEADECILVSATKALTTLTLSKRIKLKQRRKEK